MKPDIRHRMFALAVKLEAHAREAAALHAALSAEGQWGTGATQRMERRLANEAEKLRTLLDADPEKPAS